MSAAVFIVSLSVLLMTLGRSISFDYGHRNTRIESANDIITFRRVSSLVESCCVLVSLPNTSGALKRVLADTYSTFKEDDSVCFAHLSDIPESSINDPLQRDTGLAYFPRRQRDLSCLHPPPKVAPKAEPVTGVFSAEQLVEFVNSHCGTYRSLGGSFNSVGQRREELLATLYDVPDGDDSQSEVEQCKRVSGLSRDEFFKQYMSISKPVIVENALANWTAVTKWSNSFFYDHFGARRVHVKLSPDGEFEGCEPDSVWAGHSERRMPAHVRQQIEFPDLVVVRPATADVPFSAFMDHITSRKRPHDVYSRISRSAAGGNVSAYLEYTSIPNYMPELENDISPMPFLPKGVRREHLNLWLSNGNTLGKLHFDPYDNILAQVSLLRT